MSISYPVVVWGKVQRVKTAPLRSSKRSSVHLLILLVLTQVPVGELVRAADPGGQLGQSRFTLVLDGAAVRDNNTGLVWEQVPDRIFDGWRASIERCKTKLVGGQKGWRAPTIDELKSVVDRTQKDPALPKGHPFSDVTSHVYWAATPSPTDDIVAWQVSFFTGVAGTDHKSLGRRVWCVLEK